MLPNFLLAFALCALLPSLALPSTDNNIAEKRGLPVYSTLNGTFYLTTPEQLNVDFRYYEDIKAYVPILTYAPIRLPEFKLTNGNLTTADEDATAFYGPVPLIFPPKLLSLRFGENVNRAAAAEFVAVTETDASGEDILSLFALNGREFF